MDSKRLLWAMGLSMALLVVWMTVFPPDGKKQDKTEGSSSKAQVTKKKRKGGEQAQVGKAKKPSGTVAGAPVLSMAAEGRPVKAPATRNAQPVVGEDLAVVDGRLYRAVFSSYGGVLRHLILKKKQYRERFKGKLRQVDLVRSVRAENLPLKVSFHHSGFFIPEPQQWQRVRRSGKVWVETKEKPSRDAKGQWQISYRWVDPSGKAEVMKTFRLQPDRSYAFKMDVVVKNLSGDRIKERLTVSMPSMDFGEKGRNFFRPVSLQRDAICRINSEIKVRTFKQIIGESKASGCGGCGGCSSFSCQRTAAKANSFAGTLSWGGVDEKYFLIAAAPVKLGSSSQCRFGGQKTARGGLMWTDLNFPEQEIAPGATLSNEFVVFTGPKRVEQLEVANLSSKDFHLVDSVDFGILSFLGKPMLWLMRLFFHYVGNWGIAIILITILIKLATLHWSTKSMRSMKEMARLKPEMDALKEKCGEDKVRYQQEVANLMKRHKVNPLGGCLPMLLQMPIYIAWYQALMAAVELYRAPLFGWIDDLTAPDRFYVMPVVMGLAMFLQQKMTPAATDNPQAKMMSYMMPVMFT
ncbi:MAG: membrane protein insertase YidC, partial [Deltaproteobacteria bacterium]|nr:membrane protein insertase YidC [Deltaproteobacteria bacterium]